MNSNETYKFINLKEIKWLWIIVVIIIIIITIFLNQNIYSTMNLKSIVIKEENKYHLLMSVEQDQIETIIQKQHLLINNEQYKYEVVRINDQLEVINDMNYQTVVISLTLPNIYQTENLIIKTKIIMEKERLFHKMTNILLERE